MGTPGAGVLTVAEARDGSDSPSTTLVVHSRAAARVCSSAFWIHLEEMSPGGRALELHEPANVLVGEMAQVDWNVGRLESLAIGQAPGDLRPVFRGDLRIIDPQLSHDVIALGAGPGKQAADLEQIDSGGLRGLRCA